MDDVSDNTLDVTMALGVVLCGEGERSGSESGRHSGNGVARASRSGKNTCTPGGADPGVAASRCFERARRL